MKRIILGGVMAASFSVLASCAQAQETSDLFTGQWVNDRDSAVMFTVKDGLLSGHYQTALGKPDKSKKFPLTGFTEGDQITFTVNFKGYGSLTSWTGQLTKDEEGEYIRTLWNLTRNVEDAAEDDELWQSITSGASDFRRMKSP
ncbi:MAG: avidin/streptavidin family protein [Hellea sp.]